MGSVSNSWSLFKSTLSVIGANRKLLVYPILIAAMTVGIFLFFLGPVAFQPTGHAYTEGAHWRAVLDSIVTEDSLQAVSRPGAEHRLDLTQKGWAFLAVLYFVSMFFATFFNVAFYHEILNALRGRPVSLRGGLSFALGKIPAILTWSLFAGIVGFLIKTLEERLGFLGRIVMKIVGVAWSVASVFAIPVIVESDVVNPVRALKASAGTLRKTWGEALVGYVGFQLGVLAIVLGSMVLLGGGIWVGVQLESFLVPAVLAAVWLVGILAFGYLLGVADTVYRCALYLFAAEGNVPAPFSRQAMDLAWKMKKA
jgi:Family of unknown function (DUF6159)